MFADGLRCTHNGTGGSGTITLAAANGFPQPTSAFGTSGTELVEYQIAEYTDSTFATLSKMEAGVGSLVLSTNVLTRTSVTKSWTSGGSYNLANPTALSFGNTAANVIITFGGGSATQKGALQSTFNPAAFGSDVWQPFNTRVTYDSTMSTFTMSTGARLYIPIEYIYAKPITQVAVDLATAVAASTCRMGIYDLDQSTGAPLNLLTEFTSATQINTGTGTGFKSITMGTPFWMPPGFYWLCIQASAAIAVNRLMHFGQSMLSTAAGGGRDILMVDKGASYGALPATGDAVPSNAYTRSGGGQVVGLYK